MSPRHVPRWLRRWLRWRALAPPRPGPPVAGPVMEVSMLRYSVNMPPRPPIADLATREVTQSLDAVLTVRPFAPDTLTFTVDADAGTQVVLTLTDVDTSGNRSDPSAPLSFVAT